MTKAKAVKHPTVENKFYCSECEHGLHDGGRARQVINRHIKRHHPIEDNKKEEEIEIKEEQERNDVEPEWLSVDEPIESKDMKPNRLKGVTGKFVRALGNNGKTSGITLPRESQQAVASFCWKGVDKILTKWGQAMKQDADYLVQHSDEELLILADATINSMEYHNIDVSKYLNPDITLAVLIGVYYGPTTLDIATSKMSKTGKIRAILSKIPLIGRFFRKKEDKKEEETPEVEFIE